MPKVVVKVEQPRMPELLLGLSAMGLSFSVYKDEETPPLAAKAAATPIKYAPPLAVEIQAARVQAAPLETPHHQQRKRPRGPDGASASDTVLAYIRSRNGEKVSIQVIRAVIGDVGYSRTTASSALSFLFYAGKIEREIVPGKNTYLYFCRNGK